MPSYRFLKGERLTKTQQFRLLYQQGVFYRSNNLRLWVLPNRLPFTRAGFLVTKKNAFNLVRINRIKRLLKEAYRLNKHSLKTGIDLVIGCQGRLSDDIKLLCIESEFQNLLRKAGILC